MEIPDPNRAKDESPEQMLRLRGWMPKTHVLCAIFYKYKVVDSSIWCLKGWSALKISKMPDKEEFEADDEDKEDDHGTEAEETL